MCQECSWDNELIFINILLCWFYGWYIIGPGYSMWFYLVSPFGLPCEPTDNVASCPLHGEATLRLQVAEPQIEDILPKGSYLPSISMAVRALLAGYHQNGGNVFGDRESTKVKWYGEPTDVRTCSDT